MLPKNKGEILPVCTENVFMQREAELSDTLSAEPQPVMRLTFFWHPVTHRLASPLGQRQQQLCSARHMMTAFPVCACHLLGH